jgi:hypothetical protein
MCHGRRQYEEYSTESRIVLITGEGSQESLSGGVSANSSAAAVKAEATRPGNAPNEMDPAVIVAIETLDELISVLSGLLEKPAFFESKWRLLVASRIDFACSYCYDMSRRSRERSKLTGTW